jgi:hypothetical protein
MTVIRLRIALVLLALMGGVVVIAQNPISIQRLGSNASGVTVTTTLPVSAASLPLPSGAATSALQSTINTTLGSPFQAGGSIGNTTFTVTQGTGTNLHIVCDSGCSSSTAPADASTFTPTTTPQSPVGGFFQTTATNNALTNLQMGAMQLTAQRALFINLRNASGAELGVAAAPVQVSLANTAANAAAVSTTPVDSGGTTVTNTTAHALKTFPVDPATGTALTVPSSGNGTSDSGTLRVAIASNNTAIAGAGVAATGGAPPTNAVLSGGLQSGATGGLLGGITVCDPSKGVNVTTATTTLMVTGVSGRQVRVCAVHLVTAAANNVQWISGTGATCGTGTTGIGGGGTTAASGYNFAANGGLAIGSGLGQLFTTTTTGDSLCAVTSASTQLSGIITYAIY